MPILVAPALPIYTWLQDGRPTLRCATTSHLVSRQDMHLSKITLSDVFAVLVFFVFVSAFGSRRRRYQLPHPPGPRGLPLIGHFLTFPKNFVWLTFTEWGRQYGMFHWPQTHRADLGSVQARLCPSRFSIRLLLFSTPQRRPRTCSRSAGISTLIGI